MDLLEFDFFKNTCLHVGCGDFYLNPDEFPPEQWQEIRLDIDQAVHPDILASITDMVDVPDDFFDCVYSSHNLEHIYYHEVPQALAEFRRVLKQAGRLMLSVPDLEIVFRSLTNGVGLDETLYVSIGGPIRPIDMLYGFTPALQEGTYSMAHKCGFTAYTLEKSLLNAGFQNLSIKSENFELVAQAYK